jgi:hypothetical protein
MALVLERRGAYLAVIADLRELARSLPLTQAAAKVGAFRVLLDALEKLTALERAVGFCPTISGARAASAPWAEAVIDVFVEHDVPVEAHEALVERLGHAEAA